MYIPLYNGLNCVLIPPETEKRNKETVCKVEKINSSNKENNFYQ